MLILLCRDWSRSRFGRKITVEGGGHGVLQGGLIVLAPVEETWRGVSCDGLSCWRQCIVLPTCGALDHCFEHQASIIPINGEARNDAFLGLGRRVLADLLIFVGPV